MSGRRKNFKILTPDFYTHLVPASWTSVSPYITRCNSGLEFPLRVLRPCSGLGLGAAPRHHSGQPQGYVHMCCALAWDFLQGSPWPWGVPASGTLSSMPPQPLPFSFPQLGGDYPLHGPWVRTLGVLSSGHNVGADTTCFPSGPHPPPIIIVLSVSLIAPITSEVTFHQPPSRALSTGRSGVFLGRQGSGDGGQVAHSFRIKRGPHKRYLTGPLRQQGLQKGLGFCCKTRKDRGGKAGGAPFP